MNEVGLDLRIRGGKIVFGYQTKDYEIRSHPYEPCTYICQGEQVLHTIRYGFETSQIEQMIMRDKEFRSIDGRMIGCDMMKDVLAATIDEGRAVLDFSYATNLALKRCEKREQHLEHQEQLYQAEIRERKQNRFSTTHTNSCNIASKRSTRTDSDNTSSPKRRYIYRGESEREFYLVFTMAHELDEYYIREEAERDIEPQEPMGVIIVAKDYESEWIAWHKNYFGWLVVIAPVASQYVKGFNDPHWIVIEDNTDAEPSGYKHVIYQSPEGKIVATTPLTTLDIADSLKDYAQMSKEDVRNLCYSSEMNHAR